MPNGEGAIDLEGLMETFSADEILEANDGRVAGDRRGGPRGLPPAEDEVTTAERWWFWVTGVVTGVALTLWVTRGF